MRGSAAVVHAAEDADGLQRHHVLAWSECQAQLVEATRDPPAQAPTCDLLHILAHRVVAIARCNWRRHLRHGARGHSQAL